MLTHVRIRLPAGTRASPALAALGELRRHGPDWRLTLATDLRAGGLRAIDRQLDALLGPGERLTTCWPTSDFDTVLHDQLEDLFGRRHHTHLALGFWVTGAGWALAVAASPAGAVTVSASYLRDALGELVAMGLTALDQGAGRASFAEEPGEYRWVFEGDRLRILSFDDEDGRPDAAGEAVFDSPCTAHELASAVLACAEAVEERYGPDEYLRQWVEARFPAEGVAALRAALR